MRRTSGLCAGRRTAVLGALGFGLVRATTPAAAQRSASIRVGWLVSAPRSKLPPYVAAIEEGLRARGCRDRCCFAPTR